MGGQTSIEERDKRSSYSSRPRLPTIKESDIEGWNESSTLFGHPNDWWELVVNSCGDQISREVLLKPWKPLHAEDTWGQNFELDDYIEDAKILLDLSPQLKTLRFKMVPGARVKEDQFWRRLFGLVRRYLIDLAATIEQQKNGNKNSVAINEENSGGNHQVERKRSVVESPQVTCNVENEQHDPVYGAPLVPVTASPNKEASANGDVIVYYSGPDPSPVRKHPTTRNDSSNIHTETTTRSSDTSSVSPSVMERPSSVSCHSLNKTTAPMLLSTKEENARLCKLLQDAEERNQILLQQVQYYKSISQSKIQCQRCGESYNASAADGKTQPKQTCYYHKGNWQMDKDSREFLQLPEDLKSNLRAEKQKRLQEVEEKLRFVLKTDDISDTHGEWTCCNQTEYHSTGCAHKSKHMPGPSVSCPSPSLIPNIDPNHLRPSSPQDISI